MSRSSWALRVGLVRNAKASTHLITFVVAAVSTVVLTRMFLAATGYPRIGGDGLHIAHMLPGGLLMLVALFLLLSYVGPVVRPYAALLGGIGFGLFIDEIGKFVTSDNDYFYRPAFGIMYAVFVALVLAVYAVHHLRPLDPRERLSNTVDQAVEGVAGGLSRHRRAEARRQLDAVRPGYPRRSETHVLVDACAHDEVELPPVVERTRDAIVTMFERLVTRRWAMPIVTVVLLAKVPLSQDLAGIAERIADGKLFTVSMVGLIGGLLASLVLVLRGAWSMRGSWNDGANHANRADQVNRTNWTDRADTATRRELGTQAFTLSLLVSLLFTRVFEFGWHQLGAGSGLLLDLVLLGLVAAERERLNQRRLDRDGGPTEAASGTA